MLKFGQDNSLREYVDESIENEKFSDSVLKIACSFIDGYMEKVNGKDLPPKGLFTYHQGVFLSGVEKIYEITKNKKYSGYIESYLNEVLDENKRAKRFEDHFWASLNSLDFRQAGILFDRIYRETKDNRYLDSMAELCESLDYFPKNSKGGFWHMKSMANQMWLDGLYMIGPLCAKFAVLSGKRKYGDEAINQALIMYDNMHDERNNLLFHGWNEDKSAPWANKLTGLSPEKWGRAVGWYLVAAMDIIEILDDSYKNIQRLKEAIKKMLGSVVKFSSDNQMWYQVVDKPKKEDNWEEVSASCLITYAIAKAIRTGIIDKTFSDITIRAYQGISSYIKNGDDNLPKLTGVCVGTNIDDGSYEHYINCETSDNDLHGIGAFLLMSAELVKLFTNIYT